jgi:hypothetical protein
MVMENAADEAQSSKLKAQEKFQVPGGKFQAQRSRARRLELDRWSFL